jgi:hypothetical protein
MAWIAAIRNGWECFPAALSLSRLEERMSGDVPDLKHCFPSRDLPVSTEPRAKSRIRAPLTANQRCLSHIVATPPPIGAVGWRLGDCRDRP